MVHSAFIDT